MDMEAIHPNFHVLTPANSLKIGVRQKIGLVNSKIIEISYLSREINLTLKSKENITSSVDF